MPPPKHYRKPTLCRVPGTKGAPPLPPSAAGPVPSTSNPNVKHAPGTTPPAASAPNVPGAAGGPETRDGSVSVESRRLTFRSKNPKRSRSFRNRHRNGWCRPPPRSAAVSPRPVPPAPPKPQIRQAEPPPSRAASGEARASTPSARATAEAGPPDRAAGSAAATAGSAASAGPAASRSGQEMPSERSEMLKRLVRPQALGV